MKQDDVGVRQLDNGNWEFRYILKVNGETIMGRKRKDESGEPFKTKKAAVRARSLAIEKATFEAQAKHTAPSAFLEKRTFAEVYQEYCEKGRSGKAYNTIKKQDSLWRNHLCAKFGHRYIDEVSVAEIMDYLTDLYYVEHRAYKYVEGFLKMFYLIFGQAYSRNYLDMDTYSKLCLNKGTKITMPKMKADEDDDIVIFSMEDLEKLDEYFLGTNGETAYLLGRYCGLRINECYGLKYFSKTKEWFMTNVKSPIPVDRLNHLYNEYSQWCIEHALIPIGDLDFNAKLFYLKDHMKAYTPTPEEIKEISTKWHS